MGEGRRERGGRERIGEGRGCCLQLVGEDHRPCVASKPSVQARS